MRFLAGNRLQPPMLAAALIGVTVLGLATRLIGLTGDLWIDEIATLDTLREVGPMGVLTGYSGANQHTLNSILVWASITLFGESEWSVRLPAMLFGVASVPVFYWVARAARFSQGLSLFAALLLALNYQHVWFSQNARGYTGYVLFSLISTGALLRLAWSDARYLVILFVGASGLNFLSLLPAVFVFGAQSLVAGVGLVLGRRMTVDRDLPDGRLVITALACAGGLAVLIYAPLVREMLMVLDTTAPGQVTALRLFSRGFISEVWRGAAAGLPRPVLWLGVVPAGLAVWGAVRLARQAPALVAILLGAHVLFAAAVLVLGWPVYPRLFLLVLPLGLLAAVALLGALPAWAGARPASRLFVGAVVAGILAVSVVSLRSAYSMPKQPYRMALSLARQAVGTGGTIVAAGVADRGILYYAARGAVGASATIGGARSLEAFDRLLTGVDPESAVVLTTFNGALAAEVPALWQRLEAAWVPCAVIRGSVRAGEITIWLPRGGDPSDAAAGPSLTGDDGRCSRVDRI